MKDVVLKIKARKRSGAQFLVKRNKLGARTAVIVSFALLSVEWNDNSYKQTTFFQHDSYGA
jgi:hypothetical protein